MRYDFDHSLFLALNFDGGPTLDAVMFFLSGNLLWVPLCLLVLLLMVRRFGWCRTLLFVAALALAVGAADLIAGIFKHSGPLKHLWADFPPRWRPMFTPALEGLGIPADTLYSWRAAGLPTAGAVHVPVGAVAGKYGTVSSHAAVAAALAVMAAGEIRRRWFTLTMIVWTLAVCYSRIYLAKHFPVDLLLGLTVGALCGRSLLALYRVAAKRWCRASRNQ